MSQFSAILVLALLLVCSQNCKAVKRESDNDKPLDAKSFGIDNPMFIATIHAINIGINTVLENGDSVVGSLNGKFDKVAKDLQDILQNIRSLVTSPITNLEDLANTMEKLKKSFQDIDDILNQSRSTGVPVDSLPQVIAINSALKLVIPAIDVVEKISRVGGAVSQEFLNAMMKITNSTQ